MLMYEGPKTEEEKRMDFVTCAVLLAALGVFFGAQLSGAIAIEGLAFTRIELAVAAIGSSSLGSFMLGHAIGSRRKPA